MQTVLQVQIVVQRGELAARTQLQRQTAPGGIGDPQGCVEVTHFACSES
jgi:hypothetical protein